MVGSVAEGVARLHYHRQLVYRGNRLIDVMYKDKEEQLLGYPARFAAWIFAAWIKENDGQYEIQSGIPLTEKPRRLSPTD